MEEIKIIKWDQDGANKTFVYKHPTEDFNYLTQLVVHESQEAIFFMNGQALDVFGPGRHTLETQNIPLVGKALNKATGDKTPFHCEVYFVNKVEQMGIYWGTDSKIQYIEPTYNFPVSLGLSGEMSVRISDPRKLLIKIVGTDRGFSQEGLRSIFKGILNSKIKSYIAQYMTSNSINIFDVDANITKFSEDIKNLLKKDYEEYGVEINKFVVINIVKPDGDPQYERIKKLVAAQYADIAELKLQQQKKLIENEINVQRKQSEAQMTVIESQAMATKRAQEGYTYQQERGFDVASEVAKNEAVGQWTNMGVGFGTMAGVGGAVGGLVGGQVNNAINTTNQQTTVTCPKCGASLPSTAKFCLNCGNPMAVQTPNEIFCPNCGKKTLYGKFCQECGAKLMEEK